jgi:hypothetical protein
LEREFLLACEFKKPAPNPPKSPAFFLASAKVFLIAGLVGSSFSASTKAYTASL